jgi:hypothetical protein
MKVFFGTQAEESLGQYYERYQTNNSSGYQQTEFHLEH